MATEVPDGRHRFRLKGAAAEAVVHALAEESFFSDWCYPNPRLANGKELCDLLIVFDETAIIWQVKSLKLHEDGHYKKAEVEKNLRQAAGAARRLLDERRPIDLRNPRRGTEPFDPSVVRDVHLISVLEGEGENLYSAYEEIGEFAVHVFASDAVELLLTELDTIADFIHYLQAKERLFAETQVIATGGEEELLGLYLEDNRGFDRFKDATMVMVDEGHWDALAGSEAYRTKKAADEVSYGWDELIDRAHESGDPLYERVAREIARPTRFERRCLGQTMFDAWRTASADVSHAAFRRTMDFNGRTYCFLFMDDPGRTDRQTHLKAMCYAARGHFRQNRVVIGIATEKKLRPQYSVDYLFVDLPEWTPDDEAAAVRLREDAGLFDRPIARSAQMHEYPDVEAAKVVEVGRNDRCPCASGLKYKKCCGR